MAGRERLLDPTGDSERAADTTLAPRLGSLRGLTAGLLDNTKPNAADAPLADAEEIRRAMEYYDAMGWTDGLPVVPVRGGGDLRPARRTARGRPDTRGGNMSEQAVDEALRGFRDMLATDGYELRWSVSSPRAVVVQVVAGKGACADCLVPRPLMEGILADALGPAGYALDRVVLPADG